MDWVRILAYITKKVKQELLLRNEYLAAENRILKAQLKTRLHLMKRFIGWLWTHLIGGLTKESEVALTPLCDFSRMLYELRPGDVLLVEGRSRVSDVIKMITQSSWTHSAIYVGRLYDIEDEQLRTNVRKHYSGDPNEKLLIEAL